MRHVVGIAGASCSGKTFLARHLAQAWTKSVTIVTLDAYYKDLSHLPLEQRAANNFDDPQALDHPKLIDDIANLAQGKAASLPIYDFKTHTRTPNIQKLAPADLIIVEGIYALYWPELREHLTLKVYVDTPQDLCLARRMTRDTKERGRTEESVQDQFAKTVEPMYKRYVQPTRRHATLHISGQAPVEESTAAVIENLE